MKRGDEVKVREDISSNMTGEHGRIVGPCASGGPYDWRVRMSNHSLGIVSWKEDELDLVNASRT